MGLTAPVLIGSLVSCWKIACYTGPVLRRVGFVVPLVSVLACVACKKTPEPANTLAPSLIPTAPTAAAHPAVPSPAASGIPAVQVTWVDPPEWTRSEKVNAMRKATYLVPHTPSEKEDAELGVFYFGPGQGGGVEANVQRWIKQFPDAKLEQVKRADRTANGLVAHTIEIESASYIANAMGRGDEKLKANYALLGAIVEAPSGAYFFKLTGPKGTVAAAKPAFYKLLDSVRVSS
jgi:hypothetical protein